MSQPLTLARPYARAAFELAASSKALGEWAAKLAAACRCAQELREFMPDPAVGN